MKILDPCDRCGATHRLGVPCGPIMQGQIERLRAALAEKDKEVATLCQEAIRLQAAVVKAADRIAWLETHTDAALRSENERLDADIERSAESRNRLIDDYEAALKKADEGDVQRVRDITKYATERDDANEECIVLRGILEKNDATIERLEKALEEIVTMSGKRCGSGCVYGEVAAAALARVKP